MKIASLLIAASVCALTSVTMAADPKDDLAAVIKAQSDAPAFRAKMTTTGGAGMNMTVTMERVKPNQIHVKTEGGPVSVEVYSDGQKTLMRQGEGAFQEAPAQMAAMLTQNSQEAMMQQAIQAAKDVKVIGHEAVNGAPATVYSYDAEMSGMHSSNKLWVSDKDHRPVKSESEVHGSMPAGAPGGGDVNMKITSTFDYDPSIKVVMPAK